MFKKKYDIVAADIEKSCIPSDVKYTHFDLTKLGVVQEVLNQEAPDLVLLLVAMTDVDKCEVLPDLAFAINRDAPKIVAKMCRELDACLIFISTDFVFNG